MWSLPHCLHKLERRDFRLELISRSEVLFSQGVHRTEWRLKVPFYKWEQSGSPCLVKITCSFLAQMVIIMHGTGRVVIWVCSTSRHLSVSESIYLKLVCQFSSNWVKYSFFFFFFFLKLFCMSERKRMKVLGWSQSAAGFLTSCGEVNDWVSEQPCRKGV